MGRIRLLVIDDSTVMRAMMAGVFEGDREILVVGVVASAHEAETVLTRTRVDVVTLDVEMPEINGLTYLPSLVARNIPVVMLSGQTGTGVAARSQALALGAAACFDKADAVKLAPELIELVKAAARRTVRLAPTDAIAKKGSF